MYWFKTTLIWCLLGALGPFALAAAPDSIEKRNDPTVIAFREGQVFDGQAFVRRDFYVVDGRLAWSVSTPVDSIVNLEGGFVVPPLADAHTHHFSAPEYLQLTDSLYFQQGIYYAKVLTNPISSGWACRVQRTFTEVYYANGALTAPDAHPIAAYEAPALGVSGWGEMQRQVVRLKQSRIRDDDAYHIVENRRDLDRLWPQILEAHPHSIKVMINHSETYLGEKTEHGGINPALLPDIVERAHASGLEIIAHVETQEDARLAVEGGVDQLAHVWNYSLIDFEKEDTAKALLDEALARKMREKEVIVTPTLYRAIVMLQYFPEGQRPSEAEIERVKDYHRLLLRQLKAADISIALGADLLRLTALDELFYYHELGVFSNLELLNMATRVSAQAVDRDLPGALEEGAFANFLVLRGNPLERLEHLREIELRVKDGEVWKKFNSK